MKCVEASGRSVRFGVVLPPYTDRELGETASSLRDGYQFAVETINAEGGINVGGTLWPVELIIRTCPPGSQQLESAYKALLGEDNVQAVFGGYPALFNQVGMEEAELAKVPFITASGAGEFAFNRGFRQSFGLFTPARDFLLDAVDAVIRADPTVRSFAVTGCDRPEAQEDVVAINRYCLAKGLQPVPVEGYGTATGCFEYPHGNQDFSRITSVLKACAPDLLISACHLIDAVPSAVCAATQGLQPRHWIVADGPTDKHFQDALAGVGFSGDGFFEPLQWAAGITGDSPGRYRTARDFDNAFRNRFGHGAGSSSSGAATCIFVCEQAIQEAKSPCPSDIRDALAGIGQNGIQTFFGKIKFDGRGINIAKRIVTVQVRFDGRHHTSSILPVTGAAKDMPSIRPFAWRRFTEKAPLPAETVHVKRQFHLLGQAECLPPLIKAIINSGRYSFGLYGELGSPEAAETVAADLQEFMRSIPAGATDLHMFVASFSGPHLHNTEQLASLSWLLLQQLGNCIVSDTSPIRLLCKPSAITQSSVNILGTQFKVFAIHAGAHSACRFAYPTLLLLPRG